MMSIQSKTLSSIERVKFKKHFRYSYILIGLQMVHMNHVIVNCTHDGSGPCCEWLGFCTIPLIERLFYIKLNNSKFNPSLTTPWFLCIHTCRKHT